jgi:hypothetical protein
MSRAQAEGIQGCNVGLGSNAPLNPRRALGPVLIGAGSVGGRGTILILNQNKRLRPQRAFVRPFDRHTYWSLALLRCAPQNGAAFGELCL